MESLLCILTNQFPYGISEAYMETEVNYYKNKFDKVLLCSLRVDEKAQEKCRKIPAFIDVFLIKKGSKFKYALWGIFALTDLLLFREIRYLIKTKLFNFTKIYWLFHYLCRAHKDADEICSIIGDSLKAKQVIFYSYRFEYQPYVALLVKKKLHLDQCKIVSRAHRYDLYEEMNRYHYIPLREVLLEQLDYVYPCSVHGEQYLRKKYPKFSEKIVAKFLGTKDYGTENCKKNNKSDLMLVSCSNLVPVKRIDKIVEVMKCNKDINVIWTHFGDGPLMDWLKMEVASLPKNITVILKGNIANSQLMDIYKANYFDLFINLSDSEGIPVSIMEAISFGIPCLATAVGGTPEVVVDKYNGFLVDVNTTPENIWDIILQNREKLPAMRKNTRKSWEYKFNADKNYKSFVEELVRINFEN